MKSNELMIGDYIMFNKDIYKIEEISKKGWAHLIYNDGSECRVALSSDYILDDITAIPLTPEILEKNFDSEKVDFEGRHISTRYTDRNEFRDIVIAEYTDGMWEVKIDDIDFSDPPTWKVYVCDVHELQHALRLCNINKEIEI